jgi:hypothetical protein
VVWEAPEGDVVVGPGEVLTFHTDGYASFAIGSLTVQVR